MFNLLRFFFPKTIENLSVTCQVDKNLILLSFRISSRMVPVYVVEAVRGLTPLKVSSD